MTQGSEIHKKGKKKPSILKTEKGNLERIAVVSTARGTPRRESYSKCPPFSWTRKRKGGCPGSKYLWNGKKRGRFQQAGRNVEGSGANGKGEVNLTGSCT